MEIGTQVPQMNNLEEFCISLSKIGIRYIELGPDVLPSLSSKKMKKLSRILKDQKIKVYSVHAPFGNKADLSLPEEKKRKKAIFIHKEIIDKMSFFGSNILVIHPGEEVKEKDIKNRLNLLCHSLNELLSYAESNKITLALENLPPGSVGDSAEELKGIICRFNSPYLKICFDTGHSHMGGKLKEDFEIIQHQIVTFHIHDNDGVRDLHLQPPYGTIPWKDFINWVKCLSFQNPLIMECFPWGNTEFKWVKKEIELLFEGKVIKDVSSVGKTISSGYIRCPVCGHFFFEEKGRPICYCNRNKVPLADK